MNYWLIFLTGLTTGGISCVALQGGLLAAILANKEKNESIINTKWWHDVVPTVMFLISKIAVYTIFGALLGYFGSIVQLSLPARILFQVLAAVMMLGLAANMLEIHPIFRNFVIQPPKWIGRLLRNNTKSQHFFAPAVLGIFTVLIPCGVTQAMQVSAIATGNMLAGATTMFLFTLGTVPMFLAIGFLTTRLSESFRKIFFKFAALLVIFIALSALNNALVLSNSKYSLDKWVWAFNQTFISNDSNQTQEFPSEVIIQASGRGYFPNKFAVKAGKPVTLTIQTKDNYSCSSIFVIPALNINKELPVTGETKITFTPEKTGPLSFSCGMGMYTGLIDVKP